MGYETPSVVIRHEGLYLHTCKTRIYNKWPHKCQNPSFSPWIRGKESEFWGAIVRVKSLDQTMGLGPHIEFDHVRGEGVGTKRAPDPILMGLDLFKRRSEEKCLLGRTKYGLNMHPTNSKESLQWVLVAGMSPTSLWEGREYRMSRERPQLPY